MILTGLGLWVVLGLGAGWLARRFWPAPGASDGLTALWAVLGAVVGGLVAVFHSIPEVEGPWEVGPLVGTASGGLLVSSLYRFVAARKRRPKAGRPRMLTAILLVAGTTLLGLATWFVLARMNPRLYRPEVHPDLDLLRMDEGVHDPALRRALMEQLVATYLTREENAGIVIGTSVDGVRSVVSGGPAAKRNGGPPVDADSVFEIGSVSKVFAGLALAQAVVAGEARLDQEVGTLLPDDPPRIGTEGRSITLRELATHSAGLPEYPEATPWWTALTSDNPYARLSRQDLLSSLGAATEGLPEVRAYRYSSFGFTVLSHLLERATDVAYPRLLRERVFEPLGMRRTRVPLPGSVVEGLVDGHALGRQVPHWIGHEWAGAAGVVSTASDLLTFAESHMQPQAGSLGDALRLATAEHGPAWGDRKMGLGWHIIEDAESPRILYHSGNTLGSYAYLGVAPEVRVAVVVLTNSSDPTAAAIGARLLSALTAAGLS